MLSPDWIFESRPRGATRPDGHAALELGSPLMPRAKVRGAPRTVEFSLYCEFGICLLRLGFKILVRRYDRNFSPQFCESLTRKHEMLHIWTTLECLWYPKTPLWELWDPNPAPRPPRGRWPIRQSRESVVNSGLDEGPACAPMRPNAPGPLTQI